MSDQDCTRIVLITGAAGGVGRALAHRFAANTSNTLILVDRDQGGLADLAATLPESARVVIESIDVTEADAVEEMVARTTQRSGGVDVLINNAAYAHDESLVETTPDRWNEQIAVALGSVYLCSRAVLPHMRERRRGVIITMSSVNAHHYYGNEAYSAAKAGVESLTRSIAVRYGADGIRAVALGLGTILTPGAWDARRARDPQIAARMSAWYPLRRLGKPEDVAALAEFVASEEASWITGTTIMIDGGLTAGSARLADDVLCS